jgi:hypothetical protein
MDIQDLKMSIKNADPSAKMAAGGVAAGLAGAGIGGLLGGWKGAGVGGVLGGVAGAAGASAIPEAGWWKNQVYKDHSLKTKVLGEKTANYIQENPIKAGAGVFATTYAASFFAQAGLIKLARLFEVSKAGRPFTGMRPGQTLIP